MKPNEYQELAMKTSGSKDWKDFLGNGVMGLCGEAGEVIDHVKKYLYQGHKLNREKMIGELGDVLWYVASVATGLDVKLEVVMEYNIDKLAKRYPEGFFSTERSVNRNE